MSKRRFLYVMFYLPGVIAFIRVALTCYYLVVNPLGLPLRFIQLIPMLSILIANFMYFKLYSDGVPVITVIAPTMIHAVLIYVFKKMVVLVPFTPLVLLDALFLILKGVKANLFPFYIEGEDDDDLFDLEEITSSAG